MVAPKAGAALPGAESAIKTRAIPGGVQIEIGEGKDKEVRWQELKKPDTTSPEEKERLVIEKLLREIERIRKQDK